MDVGTTLKSRAKTAESVQPRTGALGDPTYLAKTAAVRFAAAGNRCGNPGRVQLLALFVAVVSPIRMNPGRLAEWSTTHATHLWDGFDQLKQLRESLWFAPVRMVASGVPLASAAT